MDDSEYECEMQEDPHPFEIDVRRVVLINHELVLEAIARAEAEEVEKLRLSGNNDFATWIESQHDEFRRAANNLALVGLVTRFHHWLSYLVNLLDPQKKSLDRSLSKELRILDSRFPKPPVALCFFDILVDVRDSIIHADSKASWTFRGYARQVDAKYVQGDEVNFTEAHLKEAFENALSMIGYYEHHVEEFNLGKYGPQIKFGAR